jgi:hypothetical protein
MPERFDEQPWYQQWSETLDKVIAAQMRRDSKSRGRRSASSLTRNMRRRSQPFVRWQINCDESACRWTDTARDVETSFRHLQK